MGIQIANVWHFDLRVYTQYKGPNTAFKPSLGELYKKHSVCTKIGLFKILDPTLLGAFGRSAPRSSRLRR